MEVLIGSHIDAETATQLNSSAGEDNKVFVSEDTELTREETLSLLQEKGVTNVALDHVFCGAYLTARYI